MDSQIEESKTTKPTTILKYRLIESSSEDPEHRLYELSRGHSGHGWLSQRYCQYPQSIIIQFHQPVNLRQINILIHEKNIPSQIRFFVYNPKSNDEYALNYKNLPFGLAGFVRMDTNTRSNFCSRELKKVYVDINCLYIKFEMDKNYTNKFNIFNQVGIMSIEFIGYLLPLLGSKRNNQFYIDESIKPQSVTDDELDSVCENKISSLRSQMEDCINNENYDECKLIKSKLEHVRIIAKKIYELEYQKRIAINNEDFDSAKELKSLLSKMRINLSHVDSMFSLPKEEQIDNEKIEEAESSIPENIEGDNSISMIEYSSSAAKQQKRVNKEEFLPYDEMIIPAVRKKINNEKVENIEDIEKAFSGEAAKGELEDVDKKIIEEYDILVKFIGEDGLKKILSKKILWKEEGLEMFLEKMNGMFSSETELNKLITSIMKIIILLLDEKHPLTVIKTLDIVKSLLYNNDQIKKKLDIDLSITDNMISKIKTKLCDIMPKIRSKTVEIYSYMLTLHFCDYNNLIFDLLEEELKLRDNKNINKIISTLEICNSALEYFNTALLNKQTDMNTFPFKLISNYLIVNITHSKSEIQKLARSALSKLIKIFGVEKIQSKLEKVNHKELAKLVEETPELKGVFPNLNNTNSTNAKSSHEMNNGNTKSRKKSPSPKKTIKEEKIKCSLCMKDLPSKEALTEHIEKDCVCYTKCIKCKETIEIQRLITHCISQCKFKSKFIKCKRCKEPISKEAFESHNKEHKCPLAKNETINNRCPLCHKDLPSTDKGFYNHLVKDGCPYQTRKNKNL